MLYTGDDHDDGSTGWSYGPFHFFLIVGAVVVVTYVCMHNRKKVCACVSVHMYVCVCVCVCVCAHVRVLCDILSYWTGFASASY